MVRTFLKVYMELGSYFLFLQEQIKDIIIIINGRSDERVSRGQASERPVCVCEAVSAEKGARRPPLPTAVVCPPGRRRRRRLAITAVLCHLVPRLAHKWALNYISR